MTIRRLLTVPEDGRHSLWNMCLQWKTTTLKGLAMSETTWLTWKLTMAASKCNKSKCFDQNTQKNPPEGNIVAWQDSQMFSSEKTTSSWNEYSLKQIHSSALRRSRRAHPPSTLTPLICVRCIFWSRESESATRIFLHPSLRRILETTHKQELTFF